MPLILPSNITAIRSPRASTSSSSDETMREPLPRLRCSTIWWCTYSIEPTSSPRVGCEATRNSSERESSRATMTFCWLPPESELVGASIEVVRMSNSLTRRTAFSLTAARLRVPREAKGARRGVLRTKLSATDIESIKPSRCRSSGMWPIPASSAFRGVRWVTSRPCNVMVPERTGRMPTSASTNSV